jgi:micrococcal nuclease
MNYPRQLVRVLGVVVALVAAVACGQQTPVSSASTTYSARVVGVTDGDTVNVLRQHPSGRREQVRVRLHGIDAPESGQPFGSKAKEALSALVHDKQVRVEQKDVDTYGRTVAVLWVGAANVNVEMVRLGMAWHYTRYAPDDRQLSRAERDARASRRGLWSDPRPVAPWEFRRQ